MSLDVLRQNAGDYNVCPELQLLESVDTRETGLELDGLNSSFFIYKLLARYKLMVLAFLFIYFLISMEILGKERHFLLFAVAHFAAAELLLL